MATPEDAGADDGGRPGRRSEAGGDPRPGSRPPEPRTTVDRRPWRRRLGVVPDRPSRLGPVPGTRVDPEAATRRTPDGGGSDPEALTRVERGTPEGGAHFDPEAPTRIQRGAPDGGNRFDPDAPTKVHRRAGAGRSDGPSWAAKVGPGPSRGGGGTAGGGGVTSGEGVSRGGGATRGEGVTGAGGARGGASGGRFTSVFPDALRARFTPQAVAGSGTEGTVWHVRRTDGGGEAAVKVAVAGQSMDADLLAHLRNDDYRRHVPHIVDFGRVGHHGGELDWVAMEYLPVTLADHFAGLRRGGRSGDRREAERIVYELVALLDFWQRRIERNPLDFKPANILVRPGRPPGEFVIADFGGVARLTASRRFTPETIVTIPYMAPEQLAGRNHEAGPWWALGNVLYELFVGRPRFLGADGLLISDEALQLELVLGEEVDLTAVADQRQLLLLQGLFTKNPDDRWTASQVRSWLAGGSPAVVRRQAQPDGGRPTHRPVTFFGAPFTDPAKLAEVLLRRSGDAARWLSAGGAERLRDWLRDDVQDNLFDLHYLTDVARAPGSRRDAVAALALLAFGAAFAPSATPCYLDRPIDTPGLERIATEADGAAFIDDLVRTGAPAVAARYDCFHPECSGEHCSRLLALAGLPDVLAEVDRAARVVGGGRRGGDGLSSQEREEAHRVAVWLSIRPEEGDRLLGRISPLPAALHRLPLPERVSELAALVAAVVVDGALAAGAGLRTAVRSAARRPAPDPVAAPDAVRRRWSALRRRAVRADPGEDAGRAALVAAVALRPRGRGRAEQSATESRQGGTGRDGRLGRLWQARPWQGRRERTPVDWPARVRAWWPHARTALPRRTGAVLLLLLAFGLLLWAGAVFRYPIEAGVQLKISPDEAFGGPLKKAGEHAAQQVVGQLGAALVAAAVLAFFPARVGFGTAALTGIGAFAIGYLRLGPPMTAVEAPKPVAERVVMFEGGMGSWAGIAAVVAIVVSFTLIERAAGRLLKPAHEARRQVREAWRRLDGHGTAGRVRPDGKRWRTGGEGVRDRVLFALGSTGVLVLLLWGAVEVRLAATGHHPTPDSWGTGQAGAAYQAGFVVLLAVASLASTLGTPVTARVLLVGWILAALVLGSWPGPLGPIEALRIPVFQGQFGWFAELWGHGAFWAALLVALPLAAYGTLRTVRWRSAG
ncbi:protein kinase domain-containing protein [Kitasatospora xanthocidica]|uniref:protein kinase domain-containing protein n=1 Tax=Kitasatospora xanthocidica TaxID=83382 RepID=UPI0016790AF8|nr:hypothetical protein [Kitasatospora xanthocidica]